MNVANYLRHNWNTEDWARGYFVQSMGNVPMEEAPEDFDKWVSMIQKDYDPARYWYDSEFLTRCFEPRMEPVKANAGPGNLQFCKSNDDCEGPMFEGGCCMNLKVLKGEELIDKHPDEFKKTLMGGICAPGMFVEYWDKMTTSSLWDYEQFVWDIPEGREMFFT